MRAYPRLLAAAAAGLVVGLAAGRARADDSRTAIPTRVGPSVAGCWQIGPGHRIGISPARGEVLVRQRWDTWSGRRRVIHTKLVARPDGTLFFFGLSSNHHAGVVTVRPEGDLLSVGLWYRIRPDAPWRFGSTVLAHRCARLAAE